MATNVNENKHKNNTVDYLLSSGKDGSSNITSNIAPILYIHFVAALL